MDCIEQRLAVPLLLAAALTIPAIAIEQSTAGQLWDTIATVLNWTILTAFLADAVVILSVVEDRWRGAASTPRTVPPGERDDPILGKDWRELGRASPHREALA